MRLGIRKTIVIGAVLFALAPLSAVAATLQKCEGVSTPNGFKYVGTYCMDYDCKYVERYVFDSWCPYNI